MQSTTHQSARVALDLPAALERLGHPPADTLTITLARSLAQNLGVPLPSSPNLLVKVKEEGELPERVAAELARRFPDLVQSDQPDQGGYGYARGRTMAPLVDRLRVLISKITESDRLAGVHLEDVRRRLRGTFGPTARVGETGDALRELGWVRVRKWRPSEDGAFATRWFPPESPEALAEIERLRRLVERREAQGRQSAKVGVIGAPVLATNDE